MSSQELSNCCDESEQCNSNGTKRYDIESWIPDVYERELLKLTWSDDFEFLYQLGTDIYSYIFEKHPCAKQLFPSVHQYGPKWRESKEFRAQALKFVQVLSLVVKNVYHMERVPPMLYDVGKKHCVFAHRGFKPEHWDIFLDAMEKALINHLESLEKISYQQRLDSIQTWRKMACYVITNMRLGYVDGITEMEHGKSS